jgi:hypothetical protein
MARQGTYHSAAPSRRSFFKRFIINLSAVICVVILYMSTPDGGTVIDTSWGAWLVGPNNSLRIVSEDGEPRTVGK